MSLLFALQHILALVLLQLLPRAVELRDHPLVLALALLEGLFQLGQLSRALRRLLLLVTQLLAEGLDLGLRLRHNRVALRPVELVQRRPPLVQLRLCLEVHLRLGLARLQRLHLLLDRLERVEARGARLIERLHLHLRLTDRLLQLVRPDDVFEVLEEAVLVRRRRLGLHHGNLLHLALQDEESVVVEVDATLLEQRCHLRAVRFLAVEPVR
mmetsp:Transcript_24447/g.78893  ORF Transcript_24447/g.78893 Transcript_24447/m.78893 type:complete len:212 (+) Transcript_24447:1350-1985(+)